jgi:hypothetical protein
MQAVWGLSVLPTERTASQAVAHHVHASQRLHLTVSSQRACFGFRQHLKAGVRRLYLCAT